MFSCELCDIFKNTFFTEHLRTTASEPFSIVLKIVDLLYGVMAPKSAIASQNFYYKVPAYNCKLSIKNSPYYQLKISQSD